MRRKGGRQRREKERGAKGNVEAEGEEEEGEGRNWGLGFLDRNGNSGERVEEEVKGVKVREREG